MLKNHIIPTIPDESCPNVNFFEDNNDKTPINNSNYDTIEYLTDEEDKNQINCIDKMNKNNIESININNNIDETEQKFEYFNSYTNEDMIIQVKQNGKNFKTNVRFCRKWNFNFTRCKERVN